MEFRGYHDYKVEVYSDSKYLGTFFYVSNVRSTAFWFFLHPQYRKWTHIHVYHRLSGTLIGQYSREGVIPAKPGRV